jgi:hypothetical protein
VILRFELVASWLTRNTHDEDPPEVADRYFVRGGCCDVAPQRMMIERSPCVQDVKITID